MALVTLQYEVTQTLTEIDARVQAGGVDYVGLPTNFYLIDQLLSGLRKRAVYLVAARPAMGKTSLALSMGMNVARQRKRVLFLSFEMSASLLALRVLSGFSGVAADKIERGRMTTDEHKLVKQVQDELAGMTFGISDDGMVSDQLLPFVSAFKDKHELDLLIVDYVSLFRDKNHSENDRLTEISLNVMSTANDLDIPIILLAQLNRDVERREGNEPMLSDLRGSGSLEQDAFAVLFPVRPHYYSMMHDGDEPVLIERNAHITVAKNRQGEVGRTAAWFHANKTLWTQTRGVPTDPPNTAMAATSLTEKVKAKR